MNQILSAVTRDIGQQRDTLEDYAAFEEVKTKGGLQLKVGIICDGTSMGLGSYYGSRAAHMTAETILNALYASQHQHVPDALKEAVQAANEYVFNNEKGKSTLGLFAIHPHGSEARLYIASVGNSVIGLVRQQQFIRLNIEHTVAYDTILSQKLTKYEAYKLPKAHYLSRVMGLNPEVMIDIGFYHETHDVERAHQQGEHGFLLQNGDTVFAFSDGFIYLDDNDIPYFPENDFIQAAPKRHLDEAAHEVIKKALARGAEDNLALVMARYEKISRNIETHIFVPEEIATIRQKLSQQTLIERPDLKLTPVIKDETDYVIDIQPTFGNPLRTTTYDQDILVIMPPDKTFRALYDEHVHSIAQKLNCTVHRSDDLFTENVIIQDIWSSIYASRLVIADCTGRNPNVFYELGIAHTLGRPVVLVTQNTQDIPFDVRDRRFLQYDGDMSYASMIKFQGNLEKLVTGFLNNKDIPPAAISSKTTAKPIFGRPPAHPQYNAKIFMMMPFTSLMRDIYEDHIFSVAKALKLSIAVGDDFFTQHAIMQDIWGAVFHAELIIADCSGRNPNVFYELGIAHTLGKPVIMITHHHDDVPTDLRHMRYLQYTYTPRGMKQFEEKLREAILKITEKS